MRAGRGPSPPHPRRPDLRGPTGRGERAVDPRRGLRPLVHDAALTDGAMVRIEALDRVLDVDRDAGLVKVEAGIVPARPQPRRSGSTAWRSRTSATSTADARRRDLDRDPRHRRRLPQPLGAGRGARAGRSPTAACSRCPSAPTPRRCRAARVGLGALGIDLLGDAPRRSPHSPSRRVDSPRPLERDAGRLDELADAQRPLRVLRLPPHRDARSAVERNRTDGPPQPARRGSPPTLRRSCSRTGLDAARRGSPAASRPRSRASPAWPPPVLAAPSKIDRSYRVFASERRVRFTEMEYAIPREHGPEAVRRVLELVRERRAPGRRSRSRFASSPRDDALLSPAHERETAATSPSTSTRARPGSPTSAPSRRSWTPTAAAPTGASATSRRRRRWRRATRGGATSRRSARASTRRAGSRNAYTRPRCSAGGDARSRGKPCPRRGRSAPRRRSLALDQVERVEALAELAGLGVAQVDAVADPQRAGGRRREAASAPRRRPPACRGGGPPADTGSGRRSGAGGARGEVAAAERGDDARAGPADDRQREERGGLSVERAVVVEQGRRVEARAGGELGDAPAAAVARQAAGPAAVDELELRPTSRTAATIRRQRDDGCRASEAALHPAGSRRSAAAVPGDPVADPGDLALVGHQAGQPSARAARRSPRPCGAPPPGSCIGERLGPIRATLPAAAATSRRRCRGRPGPRAGAAADRRLDQVEVRRSVDHQHRRRLGVGGAPARRAARSPRGRRSGRRRRCRRSPAPASHSASGSVKREDPAKAGGRARGSAAAAPAERTDFEATRIGLPAACGEHESRVGAQRVEVDERERRRDRLEDRLVAGVERRSVELHREARGGGLGRAHRGRAYRLPAPLSARPAAAAS